MIKNLKHKEIFDLTIDNYLDNITTIEDDVGSVDSGKPVKKLKFTIHKPPIEQIFKKSAEDRDTALLKAVSNNNLKEFNYIMKTCPSKEYLNTQDKFGNTALILSAKFMSGKGFMMLDLLKAGADNSLRDNKGRLAVHYLNKGNKE